ncbi:ABC transporter substrate-binding protein [Phaeobacter sp. HF9A]|uniref:substrate-binding periplasmic protein n=1 Tax=Phaeobacter sp. HF9A TaxID=2721561 RepID=UPI001431FC31|nr:transporter substrate-binding domain-containing protein [Phaeobacter sp. HF9A]NIZ14912.1 amino acid ABC transporter substrate-binding protein [Phaeobacter sp. HF9A]
MKTAAILSGVALACAPFAAQAEEPIKITYTDFCPYMCTQDADRGFTVELTEEALANQGVAVEFVARPWKRALGDTRSGSTDGTLAAARAEAPDFIFPEAPVSKQQFCFITRADSDWTYGGVETLDGVTIGTMSGLSFPGIEEYMAENEGTNAVQVVNSDDSIQLNMKKLKAGRIDSVLMDPVATFYSLGDLGMEVAEFRTAGCLASEPIYLVFSPADEAASARLAAAYTAGVHALAESGRMDEILKKYNAMDGAPDL